MLKYDEIYAKVPHPYGQGKPDPFVLLFKEIMPQGVAIDLGAGDGRNTLALTRDGWEVIAVDSSEVGLQKLRGYAEELNQKRIQTICADISRWDSERTVDAVMAMFVLHHLSNGNAESLLRRMQEKTRSKGVHAIATFTPESYFYHENPEEDWFFPTKEQLLDLYEGWEVIQTKEEIGAARQKKADGSAMQNTILRVLVRKG